jgi:hypothetical protein
MTIQNSDLSQYTNALELWHECELDKRYHALWHLDWPETSDSLWPNPLDYITKTESYQTAKKIFVVGQEGYADNIMDIDQRFYVWEPVLGVDNPRFSPYLFWFDWTRQVDMDIGSLEQSIHALTQKKYMFDCLLGQPKKHRDFIYDRVHSRENVLCSYHGKTSWVSGHPVDADLPPGSRSSTFIKYRGNQSCNASVLMPWLVYNQSWFSIVAETQWNKRFYTEKTAKPLLGRRLFVWFGAQHGLKHLRDIGFMTFDNVIDESYDDIKDDTERWSRAWDQVQYLMTQNPIDIYKLVEERLVHNQSLSRSKNFYNDMIQQIKKLAMEDHERAMT